MKFTFASLLLLLVHAVIGAPLSAQTARGTATVEMNPAFGVGENAGSSVNSDDPGSVIARSTARAYDGAMFAVPIQPRPIPARYSAAPLPGEHSFVLPLHWGSGDRLALDEGKP